MTPNTSHIINILSLTGFVRFFFQSLIELSAILSSGQILSDSYLFLLIIQISYRLSSSFYFSFIYIYSQRPFPCILSYFNQFVYTYLLFYKNFICVRHLLYPLYHRYFSKMAMCLSTIQLRRELYEPFVWARKTGCSTIPQKEHLPVQWYIVISETAKLNQLRPYYYFKYILTELPKLCDEKGNIDPAKLDHLMPWSDSLPDECRKPRRP